MVTTNSRGKHVRGRHANMQHGLWRSSTLV